MSLPVMSAQAWIAAGVGCAAIVDDLARRKISNWICLVALISGLGLKTFEEGLQGSLSAVIGAVVGGAVFLLFYVMGGLGGGDIKLLAGFGAVLGAPGVLKAALWAGGCGGLMAAAAIGFGSIRGWWNFRSASGYGMQAPTKPIQHIPYAPAIAIGAWLSLASTSAAAWVR